MIGTIDIQCNASNPNIALRTVYTFIGSPSNFRILNVPKKIGNWKIDAVFITCQYPDNSIKSVATKLIGGCYVGTVPDSRMSGKTANGFTITATGTDENGGRVRGYVLGKGDIVVLDQDSTITVGTTTYYLHLLDEIPQTPNKGDTVIIDGKLKIYNGRTWTEIGGGDSYWKKTDGKLTPKSDVSSVFIPVDTVINMLGVDTVCGECASFKGITASEIASIENYSHIYMNECDGVKLDTATDITLFACQNMFVSGWDIDVDWGGGKIELKNDGLYACVLDGRKITMASRRSEFEFGDDIDIDAGYNFGMTAKHQMDICSQGDLNIEAGCSLFINATYGVYIENEEVATVSDIPTHTSDLTNDSGFLTQHQSLAAYAKKTDLNYSYEYSPCEAYPCITLGNGETSYYGSLSASLYHIYLPIPDAGKTTETMMIVDLKQSTAVPVFDWLPQSSATIQWSHVEGDVPTVGNKYVYMIELMKSGNGIVDGIMGVRKLETGYCN